MEMCQGCNAISPFETLLPVFSGANRHVYFSVRPSEVETSKREPRVGGSRTRKARHVCFPNATDCRLQAIGTTDCSATLVFVSSLSLLIILTLGRQREREVPFLDVTSCPILPFCLQSNAIRGLFIVRICLDVDHYDYYSRLHV